MATRTPNPTVLVTYSGAQCDYCGDDLYTTEKHFDETTGVCADAACQAKYREEGSVTLFFVVIVLALLIAVGLVVDGAGRVRALQAADNAAQEAARAAGQALQGPAVIQGAVPTVDTAAGAISARSYLAAAGVQGNVTVNGQAITVSTTVTYDPVFLVFAGPMALTGNAVARPARGIDQEVP